MMILKKSFGKFIFIFVLGFFAFFNAKPVSEVLASPPVCGIKSTEVNGISDTRYHIDDITIQCNPTQIWGSIKSTARLTNDTGRVYNSEKSGGIRQRNADFDRMPGKPQSTGDSGVILKNIMERLLPLILVKTIILRSDIQHPIIVIIQIR